MELQRLNSTFGNAVTTEGIQNMQFSAFDLEKKISFIRAYNPAVTNQCAAGFRNAIIRYWTTKTLKEKQQAAKPAKMVTIPQLTLPPQEYNLPEKAAKVLLGMLEDQQDILIKGMIDNDQKMIEWESVSLESVLNAITAVRVSKRLNGEMIESWCKVALVKAFELRANDICQQKGITDTIQKAKQTANTTNDYIDLFKRLAAPVPKLDENQCKALLKMLDEIAMVIDDISNAMREKIKELLAPKQVDIGNL